MWWVFDKRKRCSCCGRKIEGSDRDAVVVVVQEVNPRDAVRARLNDFYVCGDCAGKRGLMNL